MPGHDWAREQWFLVIASQRSRECAPDDRLHEAIHGSVWCGMDCFAPLAMTRRLRFLGFIEIRDAAADHSRSHTGTRNIFFIILVDGMFTTFIARLFTKTSRVLERSCAISCVYRAGHAD